MPKSEVAVLFLNIFKKLFLFYYLLLRHRHYDKSFGISLKTFIKALLHEALISIIALIVKQWVYSSNVDCSNHPMATYCNSSKNKINQ